VFITSLVFLGAYYSVSSINKRVNALEAVTRSHTDKLAEIETQAFSSRLQDGRYASLNARMKALTDAFQSFEKRITETLTQNPLVMTASAPEPASELSAIARTTERPAAAVITPKAAPAETVVPPPAAVAQTPVVIEDQQIIEEETPPSSLQEYPVTESRSDAPIEIAPPQAATDTAPAGTSIDKPVDTGTAEPTPVLEPEPLAPTTAATPATKPSRAVDPLITTTGPWVINLLSSPDKAYVNKAMADAQSKGVDVVVTSANVKGKQYWRLQIPGFRSMAAAKSAAVPAKEKLKIKDVWIFKH
jgi:hypothetical protein